MIQVKIFAWSERERERTLLDIKLSLSDFHEEKKTIIFELVTGDKSIGKVNQNLPFDQAIEKWSSTILTIKKHIYRKGKQVASYSQQELD